MQFKPMLAATADVSKLRYPVYASPKYDGVRAIIINGKVMSRSLKEIPNVFVQKLFGNKPALEGLDGELIVGSPTASDVYRVTNSCVSSVQGGGQIRFYVFDKADSDLNFVGRMREIAEQLIGIPESMAVMVPQVLIHNEAELVSYEESCLAEGYEGIMVRSLDSGYKFGRSTEAQQWLMKVKRFIDSHAQITGWQMKMHNMNEAKTNELGYTERSSHKANMIPSGVMGALHVRDIDTGVEFDIGTGFTDADRAIDWDARVGKWVRYKYQPIGVKDKPRFPVYLGMRADFDM